MNFPTFTLKPNLNYCLMVDSRRFILKAMNKRLRNIFDFSKKSIHFLGTTHSSMAVTRTIILFTLLPDHYFLSSQFYLFNLFATSPIKLQQFLTSNSQKIMIISWQIKSSQLCFTVHIEIISHLVLQHIISCTQNKNRIKITKV